MTGPAPVYVVIGCDVDPDRVGYLDGVTPERLSWRGMTEGIPALKTSLRGLTDARGREPVFTWVIRADEQVRAMEGAYAWCVRAQPDLLRSLQESGDELGWHPHFWRRDPADGRWFQELDMDWQVDMLRRAHADLATCFPGPLKSVRMGWAYHNNRTWATLEELGIAVDFSALPGYRTLTPKPSTRSENLFDWFNTPRAPYRPSRADYRRPVLNGEQASRLMEAPSFVSTSVPWALVSGLQLLRKTGSVQQLWQAVRRPTYCINVTARPAYFAPLVAQIRKALWHGNGKPLVFVTQFHADEVVPNKSRLYNLESVRANLEAVIRTCHEASVPLEFVPACRVPAIWPD